MRGKTKNPPESSPAGPSNFNLFARQGEPRPARAAMHFAFFVPLVMSTKIIAFTYRAKKPTRQVRRVGSYSLRKLLRAVDELDQPDRRSEADLALSCFSENMSGRIFQRTGARVK
jgi:hypothetical protein